MRLVAFIFMLVALLAVPASGMAAVCRAMMAALGTCAMHLAAQDSHESEDSASETKSSCCHPATPPEHEIGDDGSHGDDGSGCCCVGRADGDAVPASGLSALDGADDLDAPATVVALPAPRSRGPELRPRPEPTRGFAAARAPPNPTGRPVNLMHCVWRC